MTKLFIFGDVHAPYHDKKAVELALKVGKLWKPDAVICMGDLFDFYTCSFYDRDPAAERHKRLDAELEAARPVAAAFSALAEDTTFVLGNHEDRLARYIMRKAPELHGVIALSKLGALAGWELTVPYGDFVRIGKVLYTHDLGYAGPYFAHRALMDAAHSIVIGHVHRMGLAVAGDITGKHRVAASFGWLGSNAHADYKHKLKANREWSHGVGLGYMNEKGVTYFTPVPFVNNSCVVEGKEVTL